jgi:cyclopropane fatty-acyl-phospholipid synthase-like methyltransferase
MTQPVWPADPNECARALLAVFGAELEGRAGVDLEFSYRMRPAPAGLLTSGRFLCWLTPSGPTSLLPMERLLTRLGAPPLVCTAQREATASVRQGVAVYIDEQGPELRLYMQVRDPATLAEHIQAWRWRASGPPRRSRYNFHFFPETADGVKPMDVVAPLLRPALASLLEDERLRQSSGFWLRNGTEGTLDQLDIAFPWNPAAGSLRGVRQIAAAFGVPPDPRWQSLPIRHLAAPGVSAAPSATLYVAAPLVGRFPDSESALQEQVCSGARELGELMENQLFSRLSLLPTLPARDLVPDPREERAIESWRAVLGADLYLHSGLFEGAPTDPDDAAVEAAQRRALTELFPLLPRGRRLYDLGCGWGGPLALWTRELGCPSIGVTPSRAQFRHVAAQGLPARWADLERSLPAGRFGCVVMLESLDPVSDKSRLFRLLRPFAERLVMRVHCHEGAGTDNGAGNANFLSPFGAPAQPVSAVQLRQMLRAAGFRIHHFRDRRAEALPTIAAWHRRLRALPQQAPLDARLEALRAFCTRVLAAPGEWAARNPLVEVVAD